MFLIECVRDYVEQLPDAANNWLVRCAIHICRRPSVPFTRNPPTHGLWLNRAVFACLSRSAFHERFSEVIGMPPLTYLTEHRLRLAARHLAQPDLSINRISERVGYTSETAFSQAFRRQYQMTPSQYRKSRAATETHHDQNHHE